MANMQQDISPRPVRRYTIPTLLQLARYRPQSFDLSKFTYDAARAGVVPPLGDCAITLRRTSGNRPRGWSTETASTNEDMAVFNGNSANLRCPERQPHGPPREDKNQKDEGFARFLKKHSSPTHNRVTAGGRIVPMEKRETPPKFDLPQREPEDSLPTDPNKQYMPSKEQADGKERTPSTEATQSHLASNAPAMPDSLYQAATLQTAAPLVINTDNATNQQSQQQVFSQYELHFNALNAYPYQVQAAYWQIPPGYYHPHPYGSHYAGPVQSSSSIPSYTTASVPPGREETIAELTQGPPYSMSQYCLKQADELCNKLQEQLREGDAKRAMSPTHWQPAWGAQRMKIVEQRDEARKLMQTLRDHIKVEKELAQLQGRMQQAHLQFNVQAPSYVPQDPTNTYQTPVASSRNNKATSETRRKPITIRPPPENSTSPAHGSETSIMRGGDQQVAKTLALSVRPEAQLAEATKSNFETVNLIRPCPTLSAGMSTSKQETKKEKHSNAGASRERRTQLMNVVDSEQDAHHANLGEQDIKQESVLGQRLVQERFARETLISEDMSNKENMIEASSLRRHPLEGRRQLEDEYSQAPLQAPLLQKPKTDDKVYGTEESMAHGFSSNHSQDLSSSLNASVLENVSVDHMSNKGFSSVSVQPVHATVRIPPSFDGAGDGTRRNAKSMLEEAGKVRSPRLMQRSTPNGRA